MATQCNPTVSYYATACAPAAQCQPACTPVTTYNPCGSSYYQTAQNQCAPPCPCKQTLFKGHDEKGVITQTSGTVFTQRIRGNPVSGQSDIIPADLAGGSQSDCNNLTWIQINGSGLSIVACCYGDNSEGSTHYRGVNADSYYPANLTIASGGYGGFDTSIAGNICSCPNTITATVLLTLIPEPSGQDFYNAWQSSDNPGILIQDSNNGQACGDITINICGGIVQGIGSVRGVYSQTGSTAWYNTDSSRSQREYKGFTARVVLLGEVCQSAGTRVIKFTSLNVHQVN